MDQNAQEVPVHPGLRRRDKFVTGGSFRPRGSFVSRAGIFHGKSVRKSCGNDMIYMVGALTSVPFLSGSSIGILHSRVLGGSRHGVSPMDSRKCQTATVSPAEPGFSFFGREPTVRQGTGRSDGAGPRACLGTRRFAVPLIGVSWKVGEGKRDEGVRGRGQGEGRENGDPRPLKQFHPQALYFSPQQRCPTECHTRQWQSGRIAPGRYAVQIAGRWGKGRTRVARCAARCATPASSRTTTASGVPASAVRTRKSRAVAAVVTRVARNRARQGFGGTAPRHPVRRPDRGSGSPAAAGPRVGSASPVAPYRRSGGLRCSQPRRGNCQAAPMTKASTSTISQK